MPPKPNKITSFFKKAPSKRTLNEDPDGEVDSFTELDLISSSVGSSYSSNPDVRSSPKRARVEIFETILSEDLVIPPEISTEEDTHNSLSFSSENLEDGQLTEDSSVFYGLLPNVPVSLDIGNFIGSVVDDRTKRALLTSHWQPPPCYTFPHSFRTMKGKEIKRSLQQTHLDAFPWAVLSESRHGLFCKYCALFAIANNGGKLPLGNLVNAPLQEYSRLLGKEGTLTYHGNKESHKN